MANGGTWTQGRHTYTTTTPSAAFNAYLGLQEDIQIIECARYAIYQSGQPTKEEEKTAQLLFIQRLDNMASLISGTTNGTTLISADQKKAMVRLLMQPSME